MLTGLLGYSLGLRHRYFDLDTQVQNATLAEGEGRRLRCARRVSIQSPTVMEFSCMGSSTCFSTRE